MIFSATTEDVIDISDLDYEWQLSEASEKLANFLKSFDLFKIGLDDEFATKICPEANEELYQCLESTTNDNVQDFYTQCLDYIQDIFPKGTKDLKDLLGKNYFQLLKDMHS